MKTLDVITIGRSSVDLYGAQVGGRLEDMGSFQKYIGGSPTNMAAGTARLGLRSALITRVGDEHMGRFIREELAREGVDVRGVKTDPERLTALVLLGIRDDKQFPLIFYRENCADMALCEDDIDEGFIAEARAVVATGTHLSHPRTEAAVLKALHLARARRAHRARHRLPPEPLGAGRPWRRRKPLHRKRRRHRAVAGHAASVRPDRRHRGRVPHRRRHHRHHRRPARRARAVAATLVCKRGPMGAAAFTRRDPRHAGRGRGRPRLPDRGVQRAGGGRRLHVRAAEGLAGRARTWPTALTYANACGAFAVSRHGCTPAYPSWEELQFFLKRGVVTPALRKDAALEQVHWSTNRTATGPTCGCSPSTTACRLEAMAGATPERIGAFKRCACGGLQVAGASPATASCATAAWAAMRAASPPRGTGLWIGRPVEWPGSRP
jgi:5-dehydro-2-deoxygluconokinase